MRPILRVVWLGRIALSRELRLQDVEAVCMKLGRPRPETAY
jgi:hypothetical protein